MIKVRFYDVGRDKKTFTASCPTAISFDWLHKQVRMFAADIAGELGFKTVHGKGKIYAGTRCVGKYEVCFFRQGEKADVTESITKSKEQICDNCLHWQNVNLSGAFMCALEIDDFDGDCKEWTVYNA